MVAVRFDEGGQCVGAFWDPIRRTYLLIFVVDPGTIFRSWAHLWGPGGTLGPLGVQGLSLGPKLGETVFNFGLHFDLILIVVQIFLFPCFGVGWLWPRVAQVVPKAPSRGETEVTWVHLGFHFGDAGEAKCKSEI